VNTVIGGDKALLDVVLRGTPKDTYAGITARDGSALESRQAWRIDTADGVVSALRVYYCSNELKRSLGAAKTYEEAIAGERV
jgi:ketosteroid isomerase-like protein